MQIALIHNNEADRLAVIRPWLRDCATRHGDGYFEVFEQPALKPMPIWRRAVERTVIELLAARWAAHLRGSSQASGRDFAWSFRRLLADAPDSFAVKARLRAAICELLTAKHFEAWRRFLQTQDALLVVLENDAIPKPDSETRLLTLAERAATHSAPLYFDLAGGLSLDVIGVSPSTISKEGDLLWMSRPVANTTCGYMINRGMAAYFLANAVRVLAPDWSIYHCFVQADREGLKIACAHTSPTVFVHGSQDGARYASTIW